MEQRRTRALFVTGTGTDVGKTYVTALLLKKLRELGHNPAYYKAAMSGNQRRPDGSLIPGDARFVQKVSGITQPLEEMCPYVYEAAVSPTWPPIWKETLWSCTGWWRDFMLCANAMTL